MSDFVGMLLQAKVDPDAVKNILSQIEGISKQAEKIKLNIDVDKNVIKDIENINKNFEKIKEIQKQLSSVSTKKLQIVDAEDLRKNGVEFERIHNSLTKTMNKIRNEYQKMGEATLQGIDKDPVTKSINQFTVKVKESEGVVKNYTYTLKELAELNGKMSKGFVLDKIKGNDKTAEVEAKYLKQAHEIRVKTTQEEEKLIQETERVFIESEKRKREEKEKTARGQAKYTNKALEDNYKLQQQEELRIKRLGENTGSIKGIDFKDDSAIRKYILSLQEAGAEVTKFQRSIDRHGNSQIKMRVTTQQSKDMLKEQKFVLDENTQSIYKQDEVLKPTINRMLGWSEAIKIAITRSIQWKISMDLLYGSLRKIEDGIGFIKNLEHESQQIQMITKVSTEEVNKLTKSYSQLADELKTNTLDLTKSATTFFRQGLDTEAVEDRITNVTKLSKVLGTSMEETAEKVTAGVNSMGVESERLGDVVTKVGVVAGTSGEEILTIIQRAGATAKQAGVSLEELASIGAVISEKTRLPSETIGASLNTIFAKFQQVNKMTGEFNEDYGKVIQAVESVGVKTINKQTNELRNTTDILKDLGRTWDGLTKKQQQFVTTAMGVRQFNRFATLLQGNTREMEILTEAQNSQNEMTDQYSIYLNKTEAAAENAKNSLQQMWQNAIQPEKIKMFYEASTSITKIIDKIGVLNTITFTLGTILLLANKRYKSFLWLISESVKELGLVQGAAFSFSTVLDLLSLKFDTVKLKALGLQVATLGLQAALTIGLSFAISKVIGWIDKQINKYNELRTANQELIQTFSENVTANNQNIQRLSELSSSYDTIKNKLKNQIELNEEEKRTLDEIIQINPSLVQGYDERGQAIIDTTQNIEDMINTLKEANKFEDLKLVQGGDNLFESAKKDVKDVQKEIKEVNRQIKESQGITYRYDSGLGKIVENDIVSLEELKKKYRELIKAQQGHTEEAKRLANQIKAREGLEGLNQQLDIQKQKLEASSTEVRNAIFAHVRLSDSYKDMSSEMRNFVGEYVKTLDVMDFDSFIDMQIAVDDFIEALKNVKFNEAVKEYQGLVKQFEDGKISAEEFDKKIKEIIAALLLIDEIPEDVVAKFFKDSSEIDNTTNSIGDLDDSLSTLKDTTDEAMDSYELLNGALIELQTEGYLSKKTLDKLIETYPELATQTDLSKDAIIRWITTEKNATKDKIQAEIDRTQATIMQTLNRIDAYASEAEALEELYGLQRAIDRGMSTGDVELDARLNQKYVDLSGAFEKIKGIKAEVNYLKGVQTWFTNEDKKAQDKINKKINQALNLNPNPQKDKPNFIDPIDAEIRAIQSKNDNLEKSNELLREQLDLAKNIEGIEGLNKQYEINGKLIENNKKLLKSYKDEQSTLHDKANNLRNKNKKYNIDSWFDANGEQTQAYVNQYDKLSKKEQENMDKVFQQMQKYKKAWMDSDKEAKNVVNTIRKLERETASLVIQQEEMVKSKVRELIEAEKQNAYLDLERRQRIANDRLKAAKQEMEDDVEFYQNKIDRVQKEIDDIQESERARAENLERAKRLEEISKLQNKYYALQYKNLSTLTEEQAKALGLEKEREQYLERQAKIQELLIKLENVRREKNIQQLTKKKDGTWDFEYVADQKEIDNINKQVEDLQKEHSNSIKDLKEQTLKDLKSKQEDYDEWERQNNIRRQIEEKQRRIQRYQDEIQDLQDRYAEKERITNEAFAAERENLDRYYTDIDLLTDEKMKELYGTFDGNWEETYGMLAGYFDDIRREYEGLIDTLSQPISLPEFEGGGNGGGSGGGDYGYYDPPSGGTSFSGSNKNTDWSKMYMDARAKGDYKTMEHANRQANIERGKGNVVTSDKDIEAIKKKIRGYSTGIEQGLVTKDHLAMLHGDKTNWEGVFTKDQLSKLLKSAVLSTVNLVTQTVPKVALAGAGGGDIKQNINIDKLEFPNVKDAREIEGAIKNLSTFANQWANRK